MPVKRLLRLAWPVALARLGIMGMAVVDVMMVGQFAPAQLPFQALAQAPVGMLTVSGIGLLSGVQILAARSIGAGKPEQAGGAWRRGLLVSALAGACAVAVVWLLGARLFSIFGIQASLAVPAARVAKILVLSVPFQLFYVASAFLLEATERPLGPTLTMWSANLVNLLLNWWLVPRFGAEGSAWCTVGARLFLAAALLGWVWFSADAVRLGVRRGPAPGLRELLGVGSAALISHAAESGAFSGMTILAGRLGGDAVSAYQILLNLLAIVFMVSIGISTATSVLTAEAVGRGELGEARQASMAGVALNAIFMLAVGAALWLLSASIGRAYTANLSLAELISSLIWLVAMITLPDGGQCVLAAALRARGDNWFPTGSHLLAYVVIMPALAYVLADVQGHGVLGLLLAIGCASIVSFAVLGGRLLKLVAGAA
jgi:MATE family multidrug resistance protein